MYGLTGEEFTKALEKGQISAKAVEQAFINLTSESGKYFNGATAQSETLAGKWSTLMRRHAACSGHWSNAWPCSEGHF